MAFMKHRIINQSAPNRRFSGRRALASAAQRLLLALLLLGLGSGLSVRAVSFCLDFTYRPDPKNFSLYDVAILDRLSEADLAPVQAQGKSIYAYISIGEVAADAPYYPEVTNRNIAILGTNSDWNSFYVDMADPAWADYVIHSLAADVVAKGYDGFFLDTVDVVELLADQDPVRAELYRQGAIRIITGLKAAYPGKKIITNRGFSIFPEIRPSLDGFLVEELFQRDDYSTRSPEDVQDLIDALAPVKMAGVPIYVVDYVSPDNLPLANLIAGQIGALGFNACVIPQEINGTVLAPLPSGAAPPPVNGYQLTLPPGYSMVANQVTQGRNRMTDLFPNLPDGTTIYKFDNLTKQFSVNACFAGQWADPNQTLSPGEGAFFLYPTASPMTLTFSGQVSATTVTEVPSLGFNLISCRVPKFATFKDVLGFDPAEGDRVYQFVEGSYRVYTFFNGDWDAAPSFSPGESFFVYLNPR